MATSAERMRALRKRERERRGFRRFTIGMSEDDLRVIAEHGYEGAASTAHDQQAQAVSLFIHRHARLANILDAAAEIEDFKVATRHACSIFIADDASAFNTSMTAYCEEVGIVAVKRRPAAAKSAAYSAFDRSRPLSITSMWRSIITISRCAAEFSTRSGSNRSMTTSVLSERMAR
jgi:hypothetical protein